MGLGLMEGLGSALLRRPSLEPAALEAHRLFLEGSVNMDGMSTCGADPLNSCSQAPVALRCGDS